MVDKIIKLFFDKKEKRVLTYLRKKEEVKESEFSFTPIESVSSENDFLLHEARCRLILLGRTF